MKIQIKDIKPNPFRDIDRYPINEKKVETLRESIKRTGFWDNCVARQVNGSVELAYGHHRLVALQREYDATHEVSLIVRNLGDADMIRIMANENMEEWGSNASITVETIRTVVQAFADGKIELKKPTKGSMSSRAAPGFIQFNPNTGGFRECSYDGKTLQEFLGWNIARINRVLSVLETIEMGIAKDSDIDGISLRAAAQICNSARLTYKDRGDKALAIKMVSEATTRAKEGKIALNFAGAETKKIIAEQKGVEPEQINAFARRVSYKIYHEFAPDKKLAEQLSQLLDNAEYLSADELESLIRAFGKLSDDCLSWANQFKRSTKTITLVKDVS